MCIRDRIAGWRSADGDVVGALAGGADRNQVKEVAQIAAAIAAFERDQAVARPAPQSGSDPWKWSLR